MKKESTATAIATATQLNNFTHNLHAHTHISEDNSSQIRAHEFTQQENPQHTNAAAKSTIGRRQNTLLSIFMRVLISFPAGRVFFFSFVLFFPPLLLIIIIIFNVYTIHTHYTHIYFYMDIFISREKKREFYCHTYMKFISVL